MQRVRRRATRWLASLALMALSIGFAGITAAQEEGQRLQALPILILNCQQDSGSVNPGGGRAIAPGELEATYGCEPAQGVAVTIYNLDLDFHVRCDTDAKGACEVQAPADPERELMVAVHTATVDPGFAPIEPLSTTVHYTEFTGVGIVNLPVVEGTPGPRTERQLLAVNVAACAGDPCEREPVDSLLAQVSPGEITSEGEPWHATDDQGMVTFDVSGLESDTIDLMMATDRDVRFDCTDPESTERLETEWIDGREGSFIRVTRNGNGDIACEITLLGRG